MGLGGFTPFAGNLRLEKAGTVVVKCVNSGARVLPFTGSVALDE